jgi:hypothetical protein
MILDIDRLHYVIDNMPVNQRGVGNTTSILYQMIGECQLGDDNNTYLYIGINYNNITQVVDQFVNLLREEVFDLFHTRSSAHKIVLKNGQQYIFQTISNATYSIRGLHFSDVWIDLDAETREVHSEKIDEILSRVR